MATVAARAPTRRQRLRRNRITRTDSTVIAAVTAVSALAAAFSGCHPTAWIVADFVLTAALAGAVTWCAASAPWWLLAGAAAIATLGSPTLPLVILGAAGFVLAVVIGARSVSWPAGRAAAAALAINVLLRWEIAGFHGASAMITGTIALAIILAGLTRRGRYARRVAKRLTIGVLVVVGLAVVGAVIAAVQSAGNLRDGERELRAAATALRQGDVELAGQLLAESGEYLDDAGAALSRPWARPALAVPIIGQHIEVLADVATEAERLAEAAATSVTQVNVETLQLVDGAVDLNAIELLEVPFRQTQAALAGMAEATEAADSPWLLAPLDSRLTALAEEVEELLAQTDTALETVQVAPRLLGAEGPRTYFVALTTPAEARGLGGFMGSFAELHADRGRLTVTRTGGTVELIGRGRTLSGPEDFLRRYGRFGAGDGTTKRPVAVDFWSNITMSPDLPSIAEVMQQLYPQSGGREIDGVIVIDTLAVPALLDVAGPITLPSVDVTLNAANAAEFLLRGQYADEMVARGTDIQAETIVALLDRLLGSSLPGPRVLAAALGPAMSEGRLAIWSADDEDQARLEDLGIAGSLPPPSPDGISVSSNNGGPNKLDAYLRRSITYEAIVDPGSRAINARATIRLTNGAPPTGLSTEAGGNAAGLPESTNRMYVSVYSPWEMAGAALDGEPIGLEPDDELGWRVYSTYVVIPPGGERTLEVFLEGFLPEEFETEDYALVVRAPPLALPDAVRVDVRSTDGKPLVASHRTMVGVDVLSANG